MRRLFIVLMVLVLVLAVGCAKKAEPAPEPFEPAPVPEMKQVQPEVEEESPAPEPVEAEPEVPATIGTRVEGTEVEAVEEEVSEDVEEIKLTADKLMSSGDKTVPVGTTLAWKNYDTWPHQLAVETGKGWDTVRHAESSRLLEGNVWEYTFEEKGTFLVRDIFSGKMRMYVTVE